MNSIPTLKVSLRPFELADAPRMAELANNKKISDNMSDGFAHPYTIANAENFIKRVVGQDPATVFAIEYGGLYVGNIGLHRGTDVHRKSAEIGYFLGEPYWNKGIMTQAVRLITEYGFKNLDIVRIYTGVFEYNQASQHVLEKCGYTKEAVFKKAICKNGQIWDEVRYAKVKEG